MSRLATAAALIALALSPLAARAAEKTVVLNVDNASCELCPPIVKKTLSRVSGVKTVEMGGATADASAVATVTFDDAKTTLAQLITATTNAGYPAHLKN
jgi:periplasmic mercuric ion binding protein